MKRFSELVVDYPKTTLALFAVLTIFFLLQIPRITVETNLDNWLPEGHPDVEYNTAMRDLFGFSGRVVIGVSHEGIEGIFNSRTLELVTRLTEEVKGLDEVIAEDVISLATQDNIIGAAEGLEVIPFMEEVPTTPEALETLRTAVHDNDMYYGTLVSTDDKGTLILAKLVEDIDKVALYHHVRDMVEAYRKLYPQDRIYFAGRPILEGVLGEEVVEDMLVMVPIVLMVVIALLALTLRTLRGVVLPLVTVVVSVIWSMGLMGLTRSPLYSMSTMVPVILIAVGCAYGIHIISRYYESVEEDDSRSRRETILETMKEMWTPVIMTALTTVVGFLSMAVSRSLPPRSVGIFTAFGVAAATLSTLTVIPAALVLMRRARPRAVLPFRGQSGGGLLDELFGWLGRGIYENKKWVFAAVVLIAVGSVLGASTVRIREGLTANMRPESETIRANDFLNEKFSGTTTINVVIEGSEAGSIKSPDLLRRMDALQYHAEQHPLVGDSVSIAEYLKRMNKVLNEDRESFNRVPESRNLVAQYLLLYSISGDPDDFEEVVDYEYGKANVSIHMKSDLGKDIADVDSYLRPRIRELFGELPFKTKITGSAEMTLLIINNVIRDQLQSFVLAIVAVFLITSIMFRSARIGLITVAPISIASMANFGLMGLLGMPLQVATTFSACVGIGIGIDYTIHFFARYRRLTAQGYVGAESNVLTMQTSGRAIFFNALVVAFGFLVLIWSNLPPNRNMGILVALNMATSFLGAMTVLPCILNMVSPETILGGPLRKPD